MQGGAASLSPDDSEFHGLLNQLKESLNVIFAAATKIIPDSR